MSAKPNNPPAFPLPISSPNWRTGPKEFKENDCGGMTLRDWFAGMALQSLISADHYYSPELNKRLGTKDYAMDAYQLAEAMLIERERKP